jgi:hypothetical protein
MRKRTIGPALCVALTGLWLHADDKPSADDRVKELEDRARAAESELKRAKELLSAIRSTSNTTASLEGVWRIVSIDGNRPGGTFVKPPYDEYKIRTTGHYLWLSFDPETGKVLRSGGGTPSSRRPKPSAARLDPASSFSIRMTACKLACSEPQIPRTSLWVFSPPPPTGCLMFARN